MIKAKKQYGQNFLMDTNIISQIVDYSDISEDDLVIEIGPGKGALTKILKRTKSNIIAFEIDERMKEVLSKLEDNKTHIIYGDFLESNLSQILSNYKYNKLFIIANLPYYITTPILTKLLYIKEDISEMNLMVQKEVADRLSSSPKSKEYGYFTVLLSTKFDIKKIIDVKNTCFNPIPKVDSAVINLKSHNRYQITNFEFFDEFVKKAFSLKRKTLRNNLGNDLFNKVLPYLNSKNYSNLIRAEELSVDDYVNICNFLNK